MMQLDKYLKRQFETKQLLKILWLIGGTQKLSLLVNFTGNIVLTLITAVQCF